MNILVVGNVLKDVYLNLDNRDNNFEVDKNNTKWLNVGFNASSNFFFSRTSSLGGAAVSLEVLEKMGLNTSISGSNLKLENGDLKNSVDSSAESHRYILISDGSAHYLVSNNDKTTDFIPPTESVDYIYIDRSAKLGGKATKKLAAYLDLSKETKLILYLHSPINIYTKSLIPRADLIILEEDRGNSEETYAPELETIDPKKLIKISESKLSYLDITEKIAPSRIDLSTHLSTYSIAAATIIGSFLLGKTVEDSLKMARANLENSKLNSVLSLSELEDIARSLKPDDNLELIAASLLLPKKGILAADESGGSIKKKFEELNIPDTYENRRDYRNILFTTPDLEKYVNGVILFDETSHQRADNGQSFIDFLISRRIIPGIKVDKGLEKFENSDETFTKGLDDLAGRLREYYIKGLRFAKWRAAFRIELSSAGELLTPTDQAIEENCRILAEYALECQSAGLVPIVEPEVIYDGHHNIDQCTIATKKVLDQLFKSLNHFHVNLRACILKVNMVLAGKQFIPQSTPKEVGKRTAEILKECVPESLAGIVFLSGGQSIEQATENLAEIEKNGPFPWPVTFSFARALQDPALKAWSGNNNNTNLAHEALKSRLIANTKILP
ncbi:fructose-bisphosphate aldolase class I [Candidatus Saccharibacteria bacterium]|nr:fructose-bisphosphate aldolase class I [Candidatus Saccharibacteria bacterium]